MPKKAKRKPSVGGFKPPAKAAEKPTATEAQIDAFTGAASPAPAARSSSKMRRSHSENLKRLTVHIDAKLLREFKASCAAEGSSVSQVAERIIREKLGISTESPE